MALDEIAVAAAGVFGLITGSFAMALAWRLPQGMNWRTDRSRCPQCGTPLGVFDLIPMVSWLLRRGRCRYCRKDISWRYPAGEMLAAVACALIVARVGPWPEAMPALLLVPLLLAASVIDLTHRYLPDGLTLAIALVGGAASWAGLSVPLTDGAIAALMVGGGTLILRALIGWHLGREALGLGDVKLFAAAGLWVGVERLPWLLLLSAILGLLAHLLWRRRNGEVEMPFGPAIALALYGLILVGF